MRAREWYSWHFPELARIVKDNVMYARVAQLVGPRSSLSDEKLPELAAITLDEPMAQDVLDASRISMGMDISEVDLANVSHFTSRLVSLAEYRGQLFSYLQEKMDIVAPNLAALIGEVVGARLISHAGSLVNLAKSPASTIQILGAEKALFRALKTKGNTPKCACAQRRVRSVWTYPFGEILTPRPRLPLPRPADGLIFHSSFIGRAAAKNKGRISRYLANKCAIASRIDSFSDASTNKFGLKLKEQVEQRLTFYETGAAPEKNLDVMRGIIADIAATAPAAADKKKKDKKRDRAAAAEEGDPTEDKEETEAARKARKAAKKAAKAAAAMDED